MSGGYTYTTIITRRGEPTRITVSFYLDDDAWIAVPGAGTDQPHLSIAHGDVSIRIGPRAEKVTSNDAKIARNLADQVATYAAEVERLAVANQADGSGTAAA
ncbi:MAG TPA: hypothetical protein VMU94_24515 [Streptosporangiaceae bacterium]|nr:hypothetical protein [Streptosporangiaceae bacterium]